MIALGDEQLNVVAKEALEEDMVGKVVATALIRKNIVPRVHEYGATMVILSDQLIGDQDNDDEWLDIIEELRRFDYNLRIVFYCERPDEDVFLSKMVLNNVTDIFNEGKLPKGWTSQLRLPPKYENTERFRNHEDVVTEDLRRRKSRLKGSPDEILNQQLIPQESKPQKEVRIKKEREIVYEQIKISPRSVAIVSLFEGVGSSTLARMLAESAAELDVDVGIMESASPPAAWMHILNAFENAEQQSDEEKGERWESWHCSLHNDTRIPAWSDVFRIDGVKYIIRDPEEKLERWSEAETAQLLAYSKNVSLLFCDVSTHFDRPEEQILLRSADYILAVGAYDVLRMSRFREKYEEFLYPYADKLIVLMNKSTPRMARAHSPVIKKYFNQEHIYHFPALIELLEVYMDGESFWRSGYVREEQKVAVRESLHELLGRIIGDEVMKKLRARKGRTWFSRFSRLFESDEFDPELDEGPA